MSRMSSRIPAVLLWGVALCAVLLIEVWVWHGGIIRLPLPIARGAGLPLPLLFWGSVAAYTRWSGAAFRLSREASWAGAVRVGCGLHILALLASLAWTMHNAPPAEISMWYVRYWYGVWGAALALGLVATGRAVARWKASRHDPSQFVFLPLLLGYLMFWGHAAVVSPPIALSATAAGALLLLLQRVPLARAGWERIVTWWREERIFLGGVALLALALRLFYTTRVMTNPDYWNTGSDGPAYDALAQALLHGGTTPWSQIPLFAPGYVRFLALLYWLFGRDYFIVCAVQSVLGALACLLLYAVAKRLFTVTVARIAALFGAVNFPMTFAAAAVGHQAVDVLLTVAVVWCLVRYAEDPMRWGRRLIPVGLLLGWAAVTREGNIAFWLFLISWFLLGMRTKIGWRAALLHVAALSVGVLVMLLPFLSEGGLRGRIGAQWFVLQHSSVNVHDWFNPWQNPTAAWALFQEQPVVVIRTIGEAVLGNFTEIFLNQGFGAFDPVFLLRGTTYSHALWTYAYLFAFAGLLLVFWRACRRPAQHLGWWLILVVLVSRALPHLFLEAAYRHRVPMEPYLILLAAYGLTSLLVPFQLSQPKASRALQQERYGHLHPYG